MHPAENIPAALEFSDAKALGRPDMAAVDTLIRGALESDVLLVSQVAEYIVTSGGKRLRPLIVLLAARALEYGGPRHINAAAIVEFIHTATLLHDDVVDHSERRRGRDTANAVFGNQASVLVGDFLYSRAFQMMVEMDDMRIMREEIFGPVLSMMPFDTEDEAIAIANDTDYGLTNYVQTTDPERAKHMARELRSGMVDMNGMARSSGSPFGGMKQSGNGREGGVWGLEDFLEVKAIGGWEA